jgi:hypothetical protein
LQISWEIATLLHWWLDVAEEHLVDWSPLEQLLEKGALMWF